MTWAIRQPEPASAQRAARPPLRRNGGRLRLQDAPGRRVDELAAPAEEREHPALAQRGRFAARGSRQCLPQDV
eukprot:1877749-Alexandrium_andersonii.AAC.1